MRFEIIFGLLCATLMGGSCADFRRGRAADGAVPVDDPVFENDVYPISDWALSPDEQEDLVRRLRGD